MKRIAGTVTLGLVLVARSAVADPTDADRALATQLFNEGRDLVVAKQYDAGCAKLSESHRLDPGGGTILNAAICHELAGRTATAWAEFTEALGWARRDHNATREQTAQEHLAALESKLSRITVVVPPASELPDLVVVRDGTPLGRAAWGSAVPVDPGSHRIEASAAGRVSWSTTVEIGADAEQRIMTVPPLVLVTPLAGPAHSGAGPSPAPAAGGGPAEVPPEDAPNPRRTIALATLGAGVLAIGIGGYFGLRAISKHNAADDACAPICRRDSVTLDEEARRAADASTIVFAAAAVALGVGGYLFFTSARPSVGKRGAMLVVEHVF